MVICIKRKYVKMINKERERKLGIALSYVNTILQAVLGFIYVPLLLFYMGVSQYGLYQLMGSLIACFSIMDFGLSTAVVRFYVYYRNKSKKEFNDFLVTAQKIYIIIAVFAMIIGISILYFFDTIFDDSLSVQELHDAKSIYILLLANMVFTLLGMLYRAIITANENFLFLKGLELFQLIFQPFLVISVLNRWPTAFAMTLVMTLINLALTVFRGMYCGYYLYIKINFFNRIFKYDVLFHLKNLMLSTFFISIVDQIFLKANQVILGIVSGTDAVATYSIAALIYTSYLSLSYAISGIFLPKITQIVLNRNNDREISDLFIQIGNYQYIVYGLVLTGFVIFGKEFISFWAGIDFVKSWEIALIIMVPYTIDMIQNIGLAILQAKNIYQIRAKVYVFVGILNIVLGIYMGKYYGGVGCAIATSCSLFICNAIMNWCYYRYVHLNIYQFWKKIVGITVVMLMILYLGIEIDYCMGGYGIFNLVFKIMVYMIVYGTFMYIFFFKCRKGILQK